MGTRDPNQLGRFRLVSPIGEGGMATVYRAWDQRLEVWRAVKVLAPKLSRKKKFLARFEGEARAMAKLEHPHIVRIYDVGRSGDRSFIVMEWVTGGSLQDRIEEQGPLPPRLAVDTALQVCLAIAHAHAHGVIHRDVKPHNVLLTLAGQCKVTDFGIARTLGESNVDLTRTGAAMGTLGFMAPEQRVDAKGADERADVYSLGATLFTLLTGRTTLDLHAAWQDESMLAGVPEALTTIILRATEFRRDKRYSSVLQLAAALKLAARKLPPDPATALPLVDPNQAVPSSEPPPVTVNSKETFLDLEATPPVVERRQTLLPTEGHPTLMPEPSGIPDPIPLPRLGTDEGEVRGEWDYARDGVIYEELEGAVAMEISLDEESRQAMEELEDQATVEEDEDTEEEAKPVDIVGWWGLRMMAQFVLQIVFGLFKFLMGPGKHLTWPVALAMVLLFGMGVWGSGDMRELRTRSTTAWAALDAALGQEHDLVIELQTLANEPGTLEHSWKTYQDATGPERQVAAHSLTRKITLTYHVGVLPSHRPAVTHVYKARVEKLGRLHKQHLSAYRAWEAEAQTNSGWLAVSFRLAEAPPALQLEL